MTKDKAELLKYINSLKFENAGELAKFSIKHQLINGILIGIITEKIFKDDSGDNVLIENLKEFVESRIKNSKEIYSTVLDSDPDRPISEESVEAIKESLKYDLFENIIFMSEAMIDTVKEILLY